MFLRLHLSQPMKDGVFSKQNRLAKIIIFLIFTAHVCRQSKSALINQIPYLHTMNQKPPKKWKLLLISWLFVYPVINILFVLIFPLIAELHQLLKTLILTLILVPLMGICIPLLHQKFWNWITQ